MNAIAYTDIGHEGGAGAVALWWMDHTGRIHEEQRAEQPLPAALFESHLEDHAGEPGAVAFGRVEVGSGRGTVRMVGFREGSPVGEVLDSLERAYPGLVWYVFGQAA